VQPHDIIKHLRAFDSSPAFRNVNKRPEETAFNDLLDPQDDPGDAHLALRKANRMRATVHHFAALDPATFYNRAILNVFQRVTFYPSRYGDGSFPVWYGCLDSLTTIHETAFYMIREEMGFKGHPKPIERYRIIYQVACTALLIDLTRETRYLSQLTDPGNYAFTQQIGKRIRSEMHPGLVAPSARHAGGINLVVFTPQILSNPVPAAQLLYRLDPQTMRLTVIDDQTQEPVISIDGSEWF
jgi:hypothetical protein